MDFFYDIVHTQDSIIPLRIRSMVGLVPLLAVETFDYTVLNSLPIFHERMKWFLSQRSDYASTLTCSQKSGIDSKVLLCILTKDRLLSTLQYC